jgi:hypothetical protein
MSHRHRPWKIVAAIAGVVIAAGAALSGTAVVSAAIGGDVGAPDVTIPLVARPDASQPISRIAVVGDIGTGAPDAYAVADRVASTGTSDPFDALVVLGDNVYPDGDATRLGATLFEPYGPVLDSGADLLPVLGNHDAGFADEQVAALGMPGRWYSAEIGDVLFIGLDSPHSTIPPSLRVSTAPTRSRGRPSYPFSRHTGSIWSSPVTSTIISAPFRSAA